MKTLKAIALAVPIAAASVAVGLYIGSLTTRHTLPHPTDAAPAPPSWDKVAPPAPAEHPAWDKMFVPDPPPAKPEPSLRENMDSLRASVERLKQAAELSIEDQNFTADCLRVSYDVWQAKDCTRRKLHIMEKAYRLQREAKEAEKAGK